MRRRRTDMLPQVSGADPAAVLFGWLQWAQQPGERQRRREMHEQYKRDYDEIIYGAPALRYDLLDEIDEAARRHDRR